MPLKRLVNLHEEVTQLRLRAVCEHYGAHVCPKVRLADVFPIENSGISREQYRYALQSHFDFLIVDHNYDPLFAVEFDGPTHDFETQTKRDVGKDDLCGRFGLPLLRIDSNYLQKRYRKQDLLSWFVDIYFCKKKHEEALEAGSILPDEPFNPFSIVGFADRDTEPFPFLLSAESRADIRKLRDAGKCLDFWFPSLVGQSDDGMWRALAGIRVSQDTLAYATAQIRAQLFPVRVDDLLDELITYKVHRALVNVINGRSQPISLAEFQHQIGRFLKHHRIWQASWIDSRNGQITLWD
jgi:hypothetical protein